MANLKPNPFLVFLGTSIYTGYVPLGPGTVASLLAIPFVFLLSKNLLIYVIATIIVTIIGIIAAQHLGKVWGKKDDGRITIDEFTGILVTFLFLKLNWVVLLIGFILFRFFDIIKPFFIRNTERVSGGLGVMLDDILAGIYANICLRILLLIVK